MGMYAYIDGNTDAEAYCFGFRDAEHGDRMVRFLPLGEVANRRMLKNYTVTEKFFDDAPDLPEHKAGKPYYGFDSWAFYGPKDTSIG
jgi:IS1 family transposase